MWTDDGTTLSDQVGLTMRTSFASDAEVKVPAQRRRLRSVGRRDAVAGTDCDELLSALARGDQEALGALFDRLGGRIFGVVRQVLRDPAQSEEVTQEVMLEVWRAAPRFDRRYGSAEGWVLTIAHRRAIDRVRSEQASRNRMEATGRRDRPRPFDEVAEQVQLREDHEEVAEALDVLSDAQREVVELAYYGGYTYREVAELLDIPLGTIKTRMRDALIRLRSAMEVSR